MASKADIILRWYKDIWIDGDWEKIDYLYQPAADTDCLIPGGTAPQAETRELVAVLNNLISDQRVRVIHTVEDGNWISALVEMYGFKAGTEIPVYMRWTTMVRVEGSCIVESYPSVNFVSFFEQLGQLPENAFELLLSGTVLQ